MAKDHFTRPSILRKVFILEEPGICNLRTIQKSPFFSFQLKKCCTFDPESFDLLSPAPPFSKRITAQGDEKAHLKPFTCRVGQAWQRRPIGYSHGFGKEVPFGKVSPRPVEGPDGHLRSLALGSTFLYSRCN